MLEAGIQTAIREEPRFAIPRRLSRYVAREVAVYSLLCFAGIITILVSQNLLRRLEELVGVGFNWADFRLAVRGMAVMFVAYAAPVSFLFGALLALRRLTGDSEILAMRACGIGHAVLLTPMLAIGALVSATTGYLMIEAEPQARRDLRTLLIAVTARGNVLQPGRFRTVGSRVIFVRERDHLNNLRGIMISAELGEERPYVIFAERGRFDFDPELAMVRISLERGDLHVEPEAADPEAYQHLSFETLRYEIDVQSLIASGSHATRPKQMTIAELRAIGARARSGEALSELDDKNPIHYELEIHRRFAVPLAPLTFAVLAAAFGTAGGRTSRSWILLVGVGFAFSYYALISFGGLLAEKAWIPAPLAAWGPTVLYALIALALLQRARVRTQQ